MCSKTDITMLATILLIYITSVSSEEIDTTCTTCMIDSTPCYNMSYLFEIEGPFRNTVVIHKLGVLWSTNTLYYSFEPPIEDKEYCKVGYINLDDPVNSSFITSGKQIMNFGTFDIDQNNGLIYLGGSDGIYVFDTKINKLAAYTSRGDRIASIQYKERLYFVRYDEFKIVKKRQDFFDTIFDSMPVKMFVMNKYNVIVFISLDGMYVKRRDETVRLSQNAFFRGLAINLNDVVYAWWVDGIYKVIIEPKLRQSKIVKVAHIPSIGALTFDGDNNFLFTAGKSLYKLTEATSKICKLT